LVSRALLFLIFFSLPAFASECLTCHETHYTETGVCSACHRGIEESSRKNIAHSGLITARFSGWLINKDAVAKGEKAIERSSCRRCHTTGGKGNGIAPNLDIESRRKTGLSLHEKLTKPTSYMPDFILNEKDADNTVRAILNSGASTGEQSEQAPLVVFINTAGNGVFETKCGTCHKLLTRKSGGKGHGTSAPNLSGLFSEFYPKDTIEPPYKTWDSKLLLKWVKNPRSIKKDALMPPQKLTSDEEKQLLDDVTN
jgi:cytochrome c2